jgi:hypothetical protein
MKFLPVISETVAITVVMSASLRFKVIDSAQAVLQVNAKDKRALPRGFTTHLPQESN